MYKYVYLSLLFITANSFGQNYYTINWAKTPENPLPVEFTTNHFELNGKVKLMVTRSPYLNEVTAFDEKGLCKGIKTIRQYDTTEIIFYFGLPTTFVKKRDEKYRKETIAFTLKYGDTVAESIPADDKGKPDERLKMIYSYNNKGLYEALNTAGENNPELQYQYVYNDDKQIIKKREHQKFKLMTLVSEKEISTTIYEYRQEGNDLRVMITETESNKIVKSGSRFYNQYGLLTYENITERGYPYVATISYIMDAQNNWVKRTVTNMTEGSEEKGKAVVTNRIIQYY